MTEALNMAAELEKIKVAKEQARLLAEQESAKQAQENKEILKSVVPEEIQDQVDSDSTTKQDETTEDSEDAVLVSDEVPEQTDSEPVKQDEDKHRSKAAEKRIAKLIKEREQLKGQLALFNQQTTQTPSQIAQVEEFNTGIPDPSKYKDGINDLDYKLDLRDYQREQIKKDLSFKEQIKAATEKYPDLPELIEEDASRSNPTMAQLIKESPLAVDLFYYLMANPEISNKIAAMSPALSAKEIGRIEAKLEEKAKATAPAATKKTTAPLPAPITPVKASKTATIKQVRYTVY